MNDFKVKGQKPNRRISKKEASRNAEYKKALNMLNLDEKALLNLKCLKREIAAQIHDSKSKQRLFGFLETIEASLTRKPIVTF